MARKRINFTFLSIGIVLVLGVVGLGAAYKLKLHKRLFYPSPDSYVAKAKLLMAEGKWEEAGKALYDAGTIKGPDAAISVMIGDVWDHLAGESDENIRKAQGYWANALSIDPRYLPAHQRLLDRANDFAGEYPHPNSFQALRETAEKFRAVDPEDKKAEYILYMASLQLWMTGGQIQQSSIDEAREGLDKMLKEDPAHADAMFQLASEKLYRAQDAYRGNDDAAMRTLMDETIALAESSLAQNETNADMHFRAGQLYWAISQIERMQKREKEAESWEERARAETLKARDLVKTGDDKHLDIQAFYAALMERQKTRDQAEQIYRALVEQYPKDQRIRLALAQLLGGDPTRREEAIELLSKPVPQAQDLVGIQAIRAKDYEARTIAMLLDLRLDGLSALQPSERQGLLSLIDSQYARLASLRGERPDVLMIRGRTQVAKGEMLEAVKSFNAALRSSEPMRTFDRIQTMDFLAKAYMATNQPGQAKRTLLELVRIMDSFPGGETSTVPQRTLLIELLLNENNPQEAGPHVIVMRRLLKEDDARLMLAEMAALDRKTQKAEMVKFWEKLPETTRGMVLDKARIAMRFLDDDELAANLLDRYRKANPDDIDIVLGMVQLYSSMDRNSDALKVVDEALAKAPDEARLQRAQKALKGEATPEDLKSVREQYVESATDPVVKEIRRYEVAIAENNKEAAVEHLLAAEKLQPDNARVLDLLFRSYATRENWDKAAEYLTKLSSVNPDMAQFQRPRFALARGQAKEAIELAQQLTRDRGDFAQSWLTQAQVQHAAGRYIDAVASYQTALERDTRSLEAMQGLVECYYRLNNPTAARRYIDSAVRVYPDNPTVREQLLVYEVQYGDPERAIGPRQEQLAKDESSPFNWIALGQAYFAAARAKEAAGKDAESKSYLQKAKEVFDKGYEKFPDDQYFATSVAEVALKMRQPEEGEKALRALIARPSMKGRPEPSMMLADYLLLAGRNDDAEKVFRDLFASTKEVVIQMRLAELLNRTKGVEEAVKVLEENLDKAAVRRLRIDLLVRAGRIEEAQSDLNKLSEGKPPSAVTTELQAAIYMHAGRPIEAMEALNKALQIDPKYSLALYRRGYLKLYNRGDADGAIADLTTVRDLVPALTDPRVTLANAYKAKGDYDNGVRELEAIIRMTPAERNARVTLLEFYRLSTPPRWNDYQRLLNETRELPQFARDATFMLAEANMWSDRKDLTKALESIRQAANAAPMDVTILRAFFDIMIQAKQYQEAITIAERLLKNEQSLWWAWQARGIARCRLNDKDGALTDFEQALKIATEQQNDSAAREVVNNMAMELGSAAAMRRVEPKAQTDNRWRMVAAQLCRAQGDFESGLKWTQMMLDDPHTQGVERDMVMGMAGEFYYSKRPPDFVAATEMFKKVADNNPTNPGALNNLAAVMTMPGSPSKPEDALVYSQRAFDLMNQTGNIIPEVLDTHGSILVQVGRVDDGIALLLGAVDRKPMPDAYYHLGEAYLRQNKPDDADKAFKQVIELITRAERDRLFVDPTLKSRVEEGLVKAAALAQQKSGAADGAK